MSASAIDVRRAADRFHTQLPWLDSWHSFSFRPHYHPDNTRHGLLMVLNDDTVAPGCGFDTHTHHDMEIVTWVVSGRLEHRDSEGNRGVLRRGLVQRMSAGTGVSHSEKNASNDEPVHFIQMWVLPDTRGVEPSYEQRDVTAALIAGGLIPVVSGQGHDGAVSIGQRKAVLWVGQLRPGESVAVPEDRRVHLFVTSGWGWFDGEEALARGDAVRLTRAGADRRFEAGADGAEVLVWQTA